MFQTYEPDEFTVFDALASERDLAEMWNGIAWAQVRDTVAALQNDIAHAAGKYRLLEIARLQHRLTGLPEAKLLAVRTILKKKSRHTPGIDGILWTTPAEKMYAALHLDRSRYRASPLLRFYRPRAEPGKMRPIGIPTMNDRAMQMLFTFALQPVAETWGDPHSYGYRLSRSAKDAGRVIREYLTRAQKPVWVLDADIEDCFDRISHRWLLRNIPLDRPCLKKMIASGYVYDDEYHPVSGGIPQGGIISPILANMTLDGLETILDEGWSQAPDSRRTSSPGPVPEIRFVRYADDFIVLAESKRLVEDAYDRISTFLSRRGLWLSGTKTRIVSADDGFDFLHWHFAGSGPGVSVTPSEVSVDHMHTRIGEIFNNFRFAFPGDPIRLLNPLLRAFAYYHRDTDAEPVFRSLDALIRYRLEYLWRTFHSGQITRPVEIFRNLMVPEERVIRAGREQLFLLSSVIRSNTLPEHQGNISSSNGANKKTGNGIYFSGGVGVRGWDKTGKIRWAISDYL